MPVAFQREEPETTSRSAVGRIPVSAALWLSFTLFIVYGTTIPFHFTADPIIVGEKISRLTLNPFVSPDTGRRVSIVDTVQNVLLFLPFGVLGSIALKHRVRSLAGRVALVTTSAALLSGAVETLQLFTTDRTTSISDVITNCTGAAIGAVSGDLVANIFVSLLRSLVNRGVARVPALYPLIVATLLVMVAAWEPFDVTLNVSTVSPKVHELVRNPWQFATITDEGVELLRYFLFGLATSAWLRQLRVPGAPAIAMFVGLAVGVGLEGSQLIIGSRMPGLEDALVHSAGAAIGAVVGRLLPLRRPTLVAAALVVVATGLGAAFQELSPFHVASTRRDFVWLPFINYYERTSFETVSHTVEMMLIYFPLGFVTTLTSRSQSRGYIFSAVLAFALAAPLEYGQGWIVGRYPDVTDIGLSVLGAGAGAWFAGPGWRKFEETSSLLNSGDSDI